MTWTVYAVKTVPDGIVRYVGLTTDVGQRASAHRNARRDREIEVVVLETHDTQEAGLRGERWHIQAHSGPHLENMSGQVSAEEMREQLSSLVARLGDAEAARRLRVSRPTLARVMSGLPVRGATLALLREGLGPS